MHRKKTIYKMKLGVFGSSECIEFSIVTSCVYMYMVWVCMYVCMYYIILLCYCIWNESLNWIYIMYVGYTGSVVARGKKDYFSNMLCGYFNLRTLIRRLESYFLCLSLWYKWDDMGGRCHNTECGQIGCLIFVQRTHLTWNLLARPDFPHIIRAHQWVTLV